MLVKSFIYLLEPTKRSVVDSVLTLVKLSFKNKIRKEKSMDNCEKCINEQRLVSLEQSQEKNSEQHKEFYCQLKEIAVSDGRKEERENARDRSIATIMQMMGELKAICINSCGI